VQQAVQQKSFTRIVVVEFGLIRSVWSYRR